MKPQVSIILPTYNRERMLIDAINSVLSQTFSDFELIVVDDGSTDSTRQILETFDDVRIVKFFRSHEGRSSARNFGLGVSKGDYVTFLDSDDLYLPNKLQIQVEFLDRNNNFGMAYTSADCFLDQKKAEIIHTYLADKSGNLYDQVAGYLPLTVCLPTVMLRREVVDLILTTHF